MPSHTLVTMKSPLKDEFDYYLANQDELVKKYRGKVVAIKNGKVLGAYSDEATAVAEVEKTEALGTFLVQRVEPGAEGHSQSFFHRVVVPA